MKTHTILASLIALACAGAVPAQAAGPHGPNGQPGPLGQYVTIAALTSEEAATLLWLREEEKLARDVYLTLQVDWPVKAFTTIARSEQRHFDAIGAKLALFALTDPALPAVGEFSVADFQAAFDQAVASGRQSYLDALRTGAGMEDREIRDLQAALEATANPALRITYQNLLEGSKTHLRTFVTLMQALGASYTPQCMDPVLYEAVIDF